jgi:hypothetical protein
MRFVFWHQIDLILINDFDQLSMGLFFSDKNLKLKTLQITNYKDIHKLKVMVCNYHFSNLD